MLSGGKVVLNGDERRRKIEEAVNVKANGDRHGDDV